MKFKIQSIQTFIQNQRLIIGFEIKEDPFAPIIIEYSELKKIIGEIKVTELEILIGSFLIPVFYKKGSYNENKEKVKKENDEIQYWKIELEDNLNELKIKNKSKLKKFESIKSTYIFTRENKKPAVRIITYEESVYFCNLQVFESIVGIKKDQFDLLIGTFISPEIAKKGEYYKDASYAKVKTNSGMVSNFNFRIHETYTEHHIYLNTPF